MGTKASYPDPPVPEESLIQEAPHGVNFEEALEECFASLVTAFMEVNDQ